MDSPTVKRLPPIRWDASKPYHAVRGYPHGQIDWVKSTLENYCTVVVCGRDTGKTISHAFVAWENALRCEHDFKYAYLAQTHGEAEKVYTWWLSLWGGLVTDKKNKDQLRYIKTRPFGLNKGGTFYFWSGDDDALDNLRGDRLDFGAIDEAGFQSAKIKSVVFPMGNSRKARWYITGTPHRSGKGFVWYKDMYDRGVANDVGYRSFTAPSESNPYSDPVYILQQRLNYRSRFTPNEKTAEEREEFDGEFVTDLGAVFDNLDRVFVRPVIRREGTLVIAEDPLPGHEYVIGQDWGALQDHSVSSVFDRHTRRQVALRVEPINERDYDPKLGRLHELHARYNKATIVGDGRDAGGYMGPHLAKRYKTGYYDIKLTNGGEHDKGAYITGMRRLFQSAEWTLINTPEQREEFTIFRAEPMGPNSNGLRYKAPPGKHDDMVMAALFASFLIEVDPKPLFSPKDGIVPGTVEDLLDALKRKRRSDRLRGYTLR